jgi:hypothetical protein
MVVEAVVMSCAVGYVALKLPAERFSSQSRASLVIAGCYGDGGGGIGHCGTYRDGLFSSSSDATVVFEVQVVYLIVSIRY